MHPLKKFSWIKAKKNFNIVYKDFIENMVQFDYEHFLKMMYTFIRLL